MSNSLAEGVPKKGLARIVDPCLPVPEPVLFFVRRCALQPWQLGGQVFHSGNNGAARRNEKTSRRSRRHP